VRREKALAKVSLKVPVERVVVRDTSERLAALERASVDLREAGRIAILETATLDGGDPSVEITLGEPEPG
jgi:hypothetical protein